MNQKEKNLQAVDAYMATKKLVSDNGSTRIINADVSYTNHKTGKITVLTNAQIIVSWDYQYGGRSVKIVGIQDVEGCFVEHSTNFNNFNFANDQLTIEGVDKTGTKGDFTLVLI
jgi:hypothetical protein